MALLTSETLTDEADDRRRRVDKRRSRRLRSWIRGDNGQAWLRARQTAAEERRATREARVRWIAAFACEFPRQLARWALVAGPHRSAAALVQLVEAVADTNPATHLLARHWLPREWTFFLYAAMRTSMEWIIDEILLPTHLTIMQAVHEAVDYCKAIWWFSFSIVCGAVTRASMLPLFPLVLAYYTNLPRLKRLQCYARELREYELIPAELARDPLVRNVQFFALFRMS